MLLSGEFEFKLLRFKRRKVGKELNSPCVTALLKQTAALSHMKKQTMK